MIESKTSHVTNFITNFNAKISTSSSSLVEEGTRNLDLPLPTEAATKNQLKGIESRQKVSLQETLPGRESDPAMQVLLGIFNEPPQKPKPYFDASNLYDASGNPKDDDINQDRLGDCYFVATLAAIADRQPQRIKDAIQYDEKTKTFNVTMYEPRVKVNFASHELAVKAVKIPVTQSEILYNLERKGGSSVDNDPQHQGALWPAVMETAFAKMYDKNWSNGLKEGFDKISGGFPSMAMLCLTGKAGKVIVLNPAVIPGPLSSLNNIYSEETYKAVDKALLNKQPVTLAVRKEFGDLIKFLDKKIPQDGLRDFHVYEVKNIYKDSQGDILISLRNPWATNKHVGEGLDDPNPIIDVKLKTLNNLGMLGAGSINIGPALK